METYKLGTKTSILKVEYFQNKISENNCRSHYEREKKGAGTKQNVYRAKSYVE
jgi:hypothetical protein